MSKLGDFVNRACNLAAITVEGALIEKNHTGKLVFMEKVGNDPHNGSAHMHVKITTDKKTVEAVVSMMSDAHYQPQVGDRVILVVWRGPKSKYDSLPQGHLERPEN